MCTLPHVKGLICDADRQIKRRILFLKPQELSVISAGPPFPSSLLCYLRYPFCVRLCFFFVLKEQQLPIHQVTALLSQMTLASSSRQADCLLCGRLAHRQGSFFWRQISRTLISLFNLFFRQTRFSGHPCLAVTSALHQKRLY